MLLARLKFPRTGRRLFKLALCLSLCSASAAVLWGGLVPSAGAATTFVVNSAGDGADANTTDGLCADAGGNCTLRAALMQANSTPGADTVNFQLGSGAQTIAPASPLPVIIQSVTIDATTQPGFAGTPLVVLSGAGAGPNAVGLEVLAGTVTVRGLVINGFRSTGIWLGGAPGSVIAGNYIGTDAAGATAVGSEAGIYVDADGARIGGTSAADRNVISGNRWGVIIIEDNTVVYGNHIGVAADGSTPLPNADDGLLITSYVNPFQIVTSEAHGNVIGGTAPGQANVIAFNGGNGIAVSARRQHGEVYNRANSFRGNSLYSNALHGISLSRPPLAGVEANDPSDADEGPNDLQNHPVLTSYPPTGGGTNAQGSLDSKPGTTYALDFYANAACDGSGQGEGQAYMGSASVTTDAAGRAQINASLPTLPPALPFLTATATDPSGNTSEFSPCLNPAVPSTVQFKRPAYETFETLASPFVITVTRTIGSSSGAASVDYATSDGTAKAGLDYVAAAGTVTFAPGETAKSIAVQLIDDPNDEETQAFNLTLTNPTGGLSLGGNSTTSINLLDNDPIPLAFAGPSFIVQEGDSGTTQVVFSVRLFVPSEKPLTVRYATQDADATAPQDYEAVSGELTFAPGETVKTVSVNVRGDTEIEFQEGFLFRVAAPSEDGRGFSTSSSCLIFDDDGAPGIHFTSANNVVAETAGHLDIRVVRRGDTTAAASVDYRMASISASAHDYTPLEGRLDFAPGETQKSFVFLVNDDAFVEDPEEVSISLLGDATGTSGFETTRVTITSNDTSPPTASNNPVDDAAFFVRQHYHDFLNREPDSNGYSFWKSQLDACGADAECRRVVRANVSAAFFLSIEFQRTGYQVFRIYAATYPEQLNSDGNGRIYQLAPLGILFPNMTTIQRGVVVGQPGWEQRLRDNTLDFARRWVESGNFKVYFPEALPAGAYVQTLFSNAGVTPTTAERAEAEAAFGAGGTEGRAAALLSATGSRSFYNSQYNAAFVAMQYYGYLRRAPNTAPDTDFTGFDFWRAKLDGFSSPGEDVRDDTVAAARAARAEMARAFVESAEYRARFGMP